MRGRVALLLGPGFFACGVGEPPSPTRIFFRDATAETGLDFVHDPGATPEKHLPETMGHGAALFDPNEDGALDLYVVQGGALPVGGPAASQPVNRLFLNEGDGAWIDATELSGAAAHRGYGMGVATGDADGDGHTDLYLTNFAADVLVLGDGDGGFIDATEGAGLEEGRWTSGAVFFDAEWDGDLDLFVTAYVAVDLENPAWCGRREPGWRTACHPDRFEGLQDRLWVNDGKGSFRNATEARGVADSYGKGLAVVASDLDRDGFLDLYVANDSVENRLWKNSGDGSFIDETLFSGTGVNRYGASEAGMGLASGDIDDDGDFDLYVTNFDHESNTLYRNDGGGFFSDNTPALGLEAATRMPVAFGALMMDFDNDADLDIALVNGHIVDLIERYHDGQTYRQFALLFQNDGEGRFVDASSESGDFVREARVGRSLIAGDVDGDGDLDLVATECGGRTLLFSNETRAPRAVFLEGLQPGVRVIATLRSGRRIHREAGPQPSYLGQTSPHLHLGTGGEEILRLEFHRGAERMSLDLDPALSPGRYRVRRSAAVWELVR